MRSFNHVSAMTVEEACQLLDRYEGRAVLNAGGTDLLGVLKDEILPGYPELVINIKTIPGLDFITGEAGCLKIGALTKLADIANSHVVRERYPVLSEASRSVATPQIRNAATIGGNLCQDIRCWYYRYPRHIGGPMQCLRKGSGPCLAIKGDNRYHAVMGGKRCFAVCPSDTAVALAALDATIHIVGPQGKRKMAVTDFFGPLAHGLKPNEIVKEIEIPALAGTSSQRYMKFTLRKPVDFAIVSVASIVTMERERFSDVRIALGAVAPGPVRPRAAEERLKGKPANNRTVADAADMAMSTAKPLAKNGYKVTIAKTLIQRALLGGG